jgi:signal transduction histidine kinase
MFSSLRARLIAWYTAMFALVVAVFGLVVGALVWQSRIAEIDAALATRADAIVQAIQPAPAGTFDLRLPPGFRPNDADDWYHGVWTSDGALIDRSDAAPPTATDLRTGAATRDGRRELVLRAPTGPLVLVGRSLDVIAADLWTLVGFMTISGVVALAVTLVGGAWLVRRALLPVDRVGRTARAMMEGDLAARIPTGRVETELEQMASALNAAFDRMQASIAQQRRFTADASHEFRTPLATMTTEIQWALGRARTADELARSLEVCQRAAARMHGVAERLLALARAEAPEADFRRDPVRLDELARAVTVDLAPLAAARRLDIQVHLATGPQPAVVRGDADALREALTIVVANAIDYNVDDGRVDVEVKAEGDRAIVTVRDTGVGIDPADLPRVFEPFFRADPSRGRSRGGAGLGLAVARAIVTRHGGTIDCESQPGQGTTVRLRLPIRAE